MAKSKGWVKLWREQFTHLISERRPWCDGYAWVYLYSQANHKPGVVNYGKYQAKEEANEQTEGQTPLPTEVQTESKQSATNKNDKNDKNDKEKKFFVEDSIEFRLANLLFSKILERKSDF